jgi:SIR2-like domain
LRFVAPAGLDRPSGRVDGHPLPFGDYEVNTLREKRRSHVRGKEGAVTVTNVVSTVTDDIARAVEREECILFLGAGVHCPPPEESGYVYPEEERPPLGSALSNLLATSCDLAGRYPNESTTQLARVSLFFETAKSRKDLVDEIKAAVQVGKRPSPAVRGLAELPFPLVITTNFDQLFERALSDAGKDAELSIYSPDSGVETRDYPGATPSVTRPFVLKLHGDVGHAESLVVTDEDYIQFVLRMGDKEPYHPIPMTFRFFFMKWTTLFVGYSLVDYNLRLLFKTLRWRIDRANVPDTYSVDLYPDPLILDVWQNQRRYVKFLAEDVWTFVPDLYRKVLGKEMPDHRG